MAEIERLVGASAFMRLAKGLRPRPIGEMLFRPPQRMRGIEHIAVALRSLQKMEDDEARHVFEMRLAREPHLFEVALGSFFHLESIHRNEHTRTPSLSM